MRISRKIILSCIAVAVVGGGIYAYRGSSSSRTSSATATGTVITVSTGTIQEVIKGLGKTALKDEQNLRFNQTGRVSNVYFSAGDKVKKGQIIAQLDATSVQNEIAQAQVSLSNSQIALAELLKGSTETQRLQAQDSVRTIQSSILTTQDAQDKLKRDLTTNLATLERTLNENTVALQNAQKAADTTSQSDERAEAQAELDIAQAQSDLAQAQIDAKNSQASLDLAKINLTNTTSVETANINQTDENNRTKIATSTIQLRDTVIDADGVLLAIDSVLGITDTSKNQAFKSMLGAKDASLLPVASARYSDAYSRRATAQSLWETFSAKSTDSIDKNSLITALSQDATYASDLVTLADTTYKLLQNSVSSPTVTDATLESLKSSVSSARSTAQSRLNSLNSTVATLTALTDISVSQTNTDTTLAQKNQSVTDAEIALQKAQNNVDKVSNTVKKAQDSLKSAQDAATTHKRDAALTIDKAKHTIEDTKTKITDAKTQYESDFAAKTRDIERLQLQLKTSEESLAETLRGATNEEILKAKNDVATRLLAIESSKKKLENYRIEAPFDGIIRSIDFKVGDNLVSDDTKYVYIQNPDIVEVSVMLDQTDIVRITPGLKTTMKFYAYPNDTFEGVVDTITGSPVETSGVVSYAVKILLDRKGKEFYSGMTQNVAIILEEHPNVMAIPVTAVRTTASGSFVSLVTGSAPVGTGSQTATGTGMAFTRSGTSRLGGRSVQPRAVVTGASDGSKIEIRSGLEIGDHILETAATGSTSAKASSSFFGIRLPGAGGGGTRSSSSTSTRSTGGGDAGAGGPPPM